MRSRFQSGVLGGTLTAAGSYLLLSTLGAVFPAIQMTFIFRLLSLPGDFLFASFSWLAFYPSLYLLYNGIQIVGHRDTRQGFYGSSLGVLPMLTLAVFLRLLTDPGFAQTPVAEFLIRAFSMSGAVSISGTVSLLALLLIVRISFFWSPEAGTPSAGGEPEELESIEEPQMLLPHSTLPEELSIPSSGVESFLRTGLSSYQSQHETSDTAGLETSADGHSSTAISASETFSAENVDSAPAGAVTDAPEYGIAKDSADEPEELEMLEPAEGTEASDWRNGSDIQIDMGYKTSPPPSARATGGDWEDELDASLDDDDEVIELKFPRDREREIQLRAGYSEPSAGVDLDLDDFVPLDRGEDVAAPHPADPADSGEDESADYVDDDYVDDSYSRDSDNRDLADPDEDVDEETDGADDELMDDDDDLPVNEDLLPHAEPSGEFNFSRKSGPYEIPVDGVLRNQSKEAYWVIDEETTHQSEILRTTLQQFGIEAEVTGIRKGPVITMFEILPAPGVKLTRIVNLADNIALALAAASVRIVAPIPGKHAVGIEVPNKRRHLVTFSEILKEDEFREGGHAIPVALGKDITGEAQIVDLAKTPHILIAGATGAGKSVCVNSIITSVLYSRDPDEVNLILIDPKIVELKFYNDIPHLLTPVITDPKKAFQALQWCLFEMERRYSLLDAMAVRDISSYNRKIVEKKIATVKLPYIVVVVDEFADLMATSGKELESTLARLAAMSRAVGIHLVLATQRPSTDVITGLIKANIPSRIAFMVASKVDSRIIIDAVGAEKLLGKGDMLLTSSWDPFPKRIQGAFLSEEEVEDVVSHVKEMGSPDYIDDEIFIEEDESSFSAGELDDPLMQKAIDIVCSANKASASYLQRRLSIGYNRAARLVEEMEDMGIVGPANGSKPREILRNKEVL